MSFMERARQAAEQARQAASIQARQATEQIRQNAPTWQQQTKEGLTVAGAGLKESAGKAKKGIITVVDKIDPGILADIVIKATALQEKANASLRQKGSPYRIAEITITATIPPQIGFSIARIGDAEEELTGHEVASMQLVGSVEDAPEGAVLSLDGELHDAESLGDGQGATVESVTVVSETLTVATPEPGAQSEESGRTETGWG